MAVVRNRFFSPLMATRGRHRLSPVALALLCATLGTAAGLASAPAFAQGAAGEARRSFDIPAGTLDQALSRFGRQAGAQIAVNAELTSGLRSPGASGTLSVNDALRSLLAGTGLEAVRDASGEYTLRKNTATPAPSASSTGNAGDAALPPVTVTANSAVPGDLPQPYAGGQVARGGRVGLLGDRDFMDTPFNLITYTAQVMQDQQTRTVADIADNNPSFRAIYPGNDAMTDFVVRGNKVKALDAAYGGLYGLMSPGVESLERIELLSGANALLNGLGPIGGVGGSINQVPKRAGDAPLTRLTTGYVSDAQFGVQADVGRRFGQDNRWGVRFNGVYSDGDTATDRQKKKVAMGALALDYRSDRLRLSADLGARRNDSDSPSRTTFLAAGFVLPAPPRSGRNWQQPWSYDNTNSRNVALRGEFDITPDLTAFAAAGGSRFEESQLFSNSQLQSSAGRLLQNQVYWPLYRDSSTAEAGMRGRFDTGPVQHRWTLTASTLRVRNGILLNTLAQTSTNIYTPVFIGQPSIAGLRGPDAVPQTGSADISGVAVADTLSMLDDRVQLTLGVRQQKVKSANFSATTGATSSSYDKSATTPGVGLVVKASRNVSVYANYIEGLQQGPTATAGSINVGQIFAPYVSKQYEAGVKLDFGGIATTLGVYQLKTPNGLTNASTRIYSVDGEQRTRGVELNTFGEVVPGVRLLGGLALVDAKQTRTAGGTNDGRQVTGAPKVQLNLGAEWDVPSVAGLTLSGRAIHTASQYADTLNAQSIPRWTRYDVGARYRTTWAGTPTTLRLNIQNLRNKSYWASAIDGYLVQSTPRSIQLSAAFDF